MGFANAVVGGITLVRAAIRSPNYVTGVSGWTINRDGSAEFQDMLIRGVFEAGGTGSSPHITMLASPNLPPPLDTYQYLGIAARTIKSAIIFYATNGSPDNYFFAAFVDNVGAEIMLFGYVRAGAVQELSAGIPLGLALTAASQFPLPPGSTALTQSTAAYGNLNWTNATGPVYCPAAPVYVTATDAAWPVPAGFRGAYVELQAAGGPGAGAAATGAATCAAGPGGYGGAYAARFYTSSELGSTVSITIGAAGTGAAGAIGTPANDSTFNPAGSGPTLTAQGGITSASTPAAAGTPNITGPGGTPPSATNGDVNVPGAAGTASIRIDTATSGGGWGGSSVYGNGGRGGNLNAVGSNGDGWGGGGGGARNGNSQAARAGGDGAPAVCIITMLA